MNFIPEAVQTLALRHRLNGNPIIPTIKHVNNTTRTLTFATQDGTDVKIEYEDAFKQYHFNFAFNTLMSRTEDNIVSLICKYTNTVRCTSECPGVQSFDFHEPFNTWMSDSLFKSVCTDKINSLFQPILQELGKRCDMGGGYIVVADNGDDDLMNTVTQALDTIHSSR